MEREIYTAERLSRHVCQGSVLIPTDRVEGARRKAVIKVNNEERVPISKFSNIHMSLRTVQSASVSGQWAFSTNLNLASLTKVKS